MRRGRTLRLSTRLALLAAAGVSVAVIAFALTSYLLISERALEQVDTSLERTAEKIALEAGEPDFGKRDFTGPPTASAAPGGQPRPSEPEAPAGTRVQLNEDGRPAPDPVPDEDPNAPPIPATAPSPPRTIVVGGERLRVLVRELPATSDGRRRTVALARPLADVEATIDAAAFGLGVGALAACALALGLALLVTRRGLRPLVAVQSTAERVASSNDLSARIEEGRKDEVGRLARAMNRMLARLETSQGRLRSTLEEQRRFAADASHELRTPLTALRGDIDLLRLHELPPDERRVVLDEMAASAERMSRLVAGLLALARAEGSGSAAPARVPLRPLLADLLPEPGELIVAPGAEGAAVAGDADGVHAILANLVANARRHGDAVSGSLELQGRWAVVRVADDGPGVPEEARERIFDRFYRAPALRGTTGAGLGLAIARTAAERHCGTLALVDAERGACFELRLPLTGTGIGLAPDGVADTDSGTGLGDRARHADRA